MQEPKERYWKVTKMEIGTELGNPNWVEWAKQEIAALRNCGTQAASTNNKRNPCCQATFDLVLEYTLGKVEKCSVCGTPV